MSNSTPLKIVRLVVAVALGLGLVAGPNAGAADLTWDADTTTAGAQPGSGTWNTTNTNWWNSTSNVSWANGLTTSNTGFNATFSGTDGSYTLTNDVAVRATKIIMNTGGYSLVNNGTNFLTLTYNDSTGSSTTDANSALLVAAGKTLNIGAGSDSTIVKLNGQNLGFSSQILVGTGSTLNINSGATVLRDNNPANGGIRFVGSGTVNLHGTLSLLLGNDGIRISERDNDTINFNVKSGGVINVNTTATNEGGASLWVAGGAAGTGSGVNTLTIESGGAVTVLNTNTAFGLTRNAGPSSIFNLAGTLTAPKVISLASTATFNFTGGTLKANANQAAFMTLTGTTVNVNNSSVIDNNGFNIGIAQAMGGAAGLTFQGGGTTTLTGASTYTGATQVNGGTLAVNGSLASAINVASGATMAGTGSTTGSLTMNGGSTFLANLSGILTASGGVNFAGSTNLLFNGTPISGNTYDVVNYGGGGVTNLSNLVSTYRATINDDIANTKITATIGAVGTRTWNVASGNWEIGGAATNWVEGDQKFFNGDSVVFPEPSANSTATLVGTLVPASVTVSNTTNSQTFNGSGSISGTTGLQKNGAGALTIANANSYTGGTTFEGGTINVDHAAALGTGALAFGVGSAKVLDSTTAGVTLAANNAQFWNDDFTFGGTNNLNMGNGLVTLGGAAGNRTVTLANGATLTTGRIAGAANGLALTGNGVLAITQSTASNIAGELSVGAGSTLRINTGATGATTNDFVATGLTGSGTVENGGGVERWLFINNSGDSTFNGVLQNGGVGPLGLNKQGAAKLTLSGPNTYTGLTTLSTNGGTLEITGSISGTSGVTFGGAQTNAVLKINTAATNPVGVGAIQLSTNGNLSTDRIELSGGTSLSNAILVPMRNTSAVSIQNISGNNTLSGGVQLTSGGSQGRIQSDAGLLTLSGSLNLANGTRTVTLQGAGNGEVSGVVSNGGGVALSLAKEGAGTWTLSNANTYTGTTVLTSGTLLVNGSHTGGGAYTVNTGATLGGTGSTTAAVTIAAGGIVSPGASIESLDVGSLSLAGTLLVEYDGAASPAIDVLNVAAGLDITLGTVDFSQIGSALSASQYVFANYGSLTGAAFTTVLNLPAGYSISYGTGSNSFIALVAIPELSSFFSVGAVTFLGLAAARLRRRK